MICFASPVGLCLGSGVARVVVGFILGVIIYGQGDQVIREDPAVRRSVAGAPKHRQPVFLSPTICPRALHHVHPPVLHAGEDGEAAFEGLRSDCDSTISLISQFIEQFGS